MPKLRAIIEPCSPNARKIGLFTVPGSNDVCLNQIFRRVRRVARDDAAFIKGGYAEIGVAATTIAAAPEHDGALFLHWVPAARQPAFEVAPQVAGRRVATSE